jgi:recombination protein RecA
MGRPKLIKNLENSAIKAEILKIINKYNKLEPVKWLRTGIHALDLMIGNGIPLARVIEVFGTESSGKSLLAWVVAKKIQEIGGIVILADVEGTADKEWMDKLGLKTDLVMIIQGRTIEDIRDELRDRTLELRDAGFEGPIFCIVDSVANVTGDGEWEKGGAEEYIPKNNIGARAKSFSEFFRQFTLFLQDQNVTLFCLNQVREKIGIMFGNKEESPGGRAIKFGASVRIRINKGAKVELKEKEIGYLANVFIEKNKVGIPHRGSKIQILYGEGFSQYEGLLDILNKIGRIKEIKGGQFDYNGKLYDNGDMEKAVTENPELLNEWMKNDKGQVGINIDGGIVGEGLEQTGEDVS